MMSNSISISTGELSAHGDGQNVARNDVSSARRLLFFGPVAQGERSVLSTDMAIDRILRATGPVPDAAAYCRHLERLEPEQLQHRLVVLEIERGQVKLSDASDTFAPAPGSGTGRTRQKPQ